MPSMLEVSETGSVARPQTIGGARLEAKGCERCGLFRNATQTVFGEGSPRAPVMLVGEQPGDSEDREGRPFVGPAGQLLNEVLREAGVDRDRCYVTNAVKHFKFTPRGKRRLHSKPDAGEIQACKWWLRIELALVKPKLVVALGGTAAQSLTGNAKGILARRGQFEKLADGTPVLMTVHPSSLLRIPDPAARHAARLSFCNDLALIRPYLAQAA